MRLTKTIRGEELQFNVKFTPNNMKCTVRLLVHDVEIEGTISDDFTKIILPPDFLSPYISGVGRIPVKHIKLHKHAEHEARDFNDKLDDVIKRSDDLIVKIENSIQVAKIISGGQTGADRGGLEAGRVLGIETGGTCPKFFRTETGHDVSLQGFGLVEHESYEYKDRTESNVEDSDGTIIFDFTKGTSFGSMLTLKLCRAHNKPFMHIRREHLLLAEEIRQFVIDHKIKVLNVAGNRETKHIGIGDKVKNILIEALS